MAWFCWMIAFWSICTRVATSGLYASTDLGVGGGAHQRRGLPSRPVQVQSQTAPASSSHCGRQAFAASSQSSMQRSVVESPK